MSKKIEEAVDKLIGESPMQAFWACKLMFSFGDITFVALPKVQAANPRKAVIAAAKEHSVGDEKFDRFDYADSIVADSVSAHMTGDDGDEVFVGVSPADLIKAIVSELSNKEESDIEDLNIDASDLERKIRNCKELDSFELEY